VERGEAVDGVVADRRVDLGSSAVFEVPGATESAAPSPVVIAPATIVAPRSFDIDIRSTSFGCFQCLQAIVRPAAKRAGSGA
jgi:hypothetical protein